MNLRPEVTPAEDHLNRAFYATQPFNYLAQRVVGLLAMKESGLEVLGLLPEEFEIAGCAFSRRNLAEDAKDAQWRFVTADSEVVLHHASETLLRLYLAHVSQPPAPWLVLARARDPRQFRKERF